MLLLVGHAGGGPLALALRPTPQIGSLRFVDGIVVGGVRLVRGALTLVRVPAASVSSPGPGVLVQLEDVRHRAFEEGPIVRDDDHSAGPPGDDLLKAGQAREVQIVRRLVEQSEVETGE